MGKCKRGKTGERESDGQVKFFVSLGSRSAQASYKGGRNLKEKTTGKKQKEKIEK